jgi:hypothetical protein
MLRLQTQGEGQLAILRLKEKLKKSVSILVMLEPLPLGERTNLRLTIQAVRKRRGDVTRREGADQRKKKKN